jgi:hypothetical protein
LKELADPSFEFQFRCECGHELWLQIGIGGKDQVLAEQALLKIVHNPDYSQTKCPQCRTGWLTYTGTYMRKVQRQ